MDRLILLRHAESLKNLEARHGAINSPLTSNGIKQVREVARKMSEAWRLERSTVWCIQRQHCIETAALLSDFLPQVEFRVAEFSMKPYSMGVLDGLSDAEVEGRYPELAIRLASYRAGRLDIGNVQIPGATDPEEFYENSMQALRLLSATPGDSVVVGTRSILVGLSNVISGNHPRADGGYREVPWINCGYRVYSNVDFRIIEQSGVGSDTHDGYNRRD
jgi:broad specificity phosphatase PhoE